MQIAPENAVPKSVEFATLGATDMNLVNFLLFLGLGAKRTHRIQSQPEDQWTAFKCRHGKHYVDPTEDLVRRQHWEHNSIFIRDHNRRADLGLYTFRLAENFYTDWSSEERMELKRSITPRADESPQDYAHLFKGHPAPSAVDYRLSKCLAPIKYQNYCGSCWAFAATVPLEYQHCARTNEVVSLSEQQLMDCVPSGDQDGDGCPYGTYADAWQFVKEAGGISSSSAYPYQAKKGECRKPDEHYAAVRTWFALPALDAATMATAVAAIGPISVSIVANGPEFDFYSSGVYRVANCSGPLNHGGAIVGYGTSPSGADYWIFRNAWGASWGLQGYMLLQRGINLCLIEQYPAFPLIQ